MTNTIDVKVKKIVDALHEATNGQNVYDALCYVPTDNLKDMHEMIVDILEGRSLFDEN